MVPLMSWRLAACAKNSPSHVHSSVFQHYKEIHEAGQLTGKKDGFGSQFGSKFTQRSASSGRVPLAASPCGGCQLPGKEPSHGETGSQSRGGARLARSISRLRGPMRTT